MTPAKKRPGPTIPKLAVAESTFFDSVRGKVGAKPSGFKALSQRKGSESSQRTPKAAGSGRALSSSKSTNYLNLLNNKPQAPPPGDEDRVDPIYKHKDPIAKSMKERFDAGGAYICTTRNDLKLP